MFSESQRFDLYREPLEKASCSGHVKQGLPSSVLEAEMFGSGVKLQTTIVWGVTSNLQKLDVFRCF